MERLSLISDSPDRELDTIRRTVNLFDRVADAEGLVEVLHRHAERRVHATSLDLIGHSRGHGFLVLGNWILDDSPQTASTFREFIRPSLDAIGIRELRMLGCSTGSSDRARTALRRIGTAVQRDVLGTRRYLSKRDYDDRGFISEEVLVNAAGSTPDRVDPVGFLLGAATAVTLTTLELSAGPRLGNTQPLLPVNEVIAHEILGFVDGSRSWVLPGLLAEPNPIVLWSQRNVIHRLEVLLDCRVVRGYGAYPDDEHGRLFRVRDPFGLSRYLDEVLRPRSERQARRT
ncbi:MAG: hypothetical protein ABJE66_11155 [Deltaproteobacteria bacterium]